MNHVSDNTPGTTWKYPEVPQSTQKYLKVSRSTSKYPEVPEHHLVWSSQFRAVCNSLKQFWTQRVICRDGMGLVIPEQPAYKSHRRAVLIIETPDWGELKTLYCKNVLLPKMCFCMWKLTVSELSPRFLRGGARIPGVQKNTKSEDSWAVYNFKIIWGGRKNYIILDMLHL